MNHHHHNRMTRGAGGGFFGTWLPKWVSALWTLMQTLLGWMWPGRLFSGAWLQQMLLGSTVRAATDGLSAPVTQRAVQQFVQYLRQLSPPPLCSDHAPAPPVGSSELGWSTQGLAACQQEAAQKQALLLVYLHSPLHGQARAFCQDILLHPTWQTFLQQGRLLAWGVSVHTGQGAQVQQLLQATALPLLALLQPKSTASTTRGGGTTNTTMNLLFRAEGPCLLNLPVEQLLAYVQSTLVRHEVLLAEQEARRLQREEETALRRQQDEEYQAALLADQERDRQVAQERQAELQRQQEEEERQRNQEEAEQAVLAKALSWVRPEPAATAAATSMVRFVLPSGAKINRRFGADEPVAALFAFILLHCHEHHMDLKRIGLSTSFPRTNYDENDERSLQEVGLCPQAVLMVQDLDA